MNGGRTGSGEEGWAWVVYGGGGGGALISEVEEKKLRGKR